MKYYLLAFLVLAGLWAWSVNRQPEDDAPETITHIKAPDEPFSYDLSGNMRVTTGILLSGEHVTDDVTVNVAFP